MRAACNNFDPYLQVKSRIDQLHAIGHATDKVDLIIMGGTLTARQPDYQEWFVKRCYDALNEGRSRHLEQAKQHNETAPSRCIGLTIETRPDWFRLRHADQALTLGTTRVELGVQTVFDDVLNLIGRGHTVSDSIAATRIAKDVGLKVCYHMMPGLPGTNPRRDRESFHTIFTNPAFKPDMVKIYPTLVIEGTTLHTQWVTGQYNPLTTETASHLIARIKQEVPTWVRIQRIQRDIPAQKISGGITKSNLRQYVEKELHAHGKSCPCIRCREIGHQSLKTPVAFEQLQIECVRTTYSASGSDEVFLSLEDLSKHILLGYLRLRDITSVYRPELVQNPCMMIREVRILGREVPLGERTPETFQHRGYGKQLIQEAERICREEYGKRYLFVLSGVGVKPYYRKLGFSDAGVYLKKKVICS